MRARNNVTGGRRLAHALVLAASTACLGCLPSNPSTTTETDTATGTATEGTTQGTGELPSSGLFACDSPPCSFVVVSQTLDDRVDVFAVQNGGGGSLRGRIDVDLKPDPSGEQIAGNLLDEPYEFRIDSQQLELLVGHYPDTDRGSLVTFPLSLFEGVPDGGTLAASEYFDGASYLNGVRGLQLEQEEPIFTTVHPSGVMMIGVFNNNLKSADWESPGRLLVVDPDTEEIAQVDLGALNVPCLGAWSLISVDQNRVAMMCDGSDSVAILSLNPEVADPGVESIAAGITGCGLGLASGVGSSWTTRFLAPDGVGGVLVAQSTSSSVPQLVHVSGECAQSGPPGTALPDGFEMLRTIRELALLRSASDGTPYWLAAGGTARPGVYIIRGAASPEICGEVTGITEHITGGDEANEPYALALDAASTHLAIGAGPTPANLPETREGRGQVLWATLDTSGLDSCQVSATSVTDLTEGLFAAGDPKTWVRAPNSVQVFELGGPP